MASEPQQEVRVRFAPSPTGHWHVGGARTTLFNWLYAKQTGGKLVLRIEDTDRARSRREYEIELIEILGWLGIDYDEGPAWRKIPSTDPEQAHGEWQMAESKGEYGPYRQSERIDIYRTYLQNMLADGRAYICYCTKEELEAERQALAAQGLPQKYSGHCRALTEAPAGRTPESIRFRMPEMTVTFTDMIRGTVSFDTALFGDIIIAKDVRSPLYNFAVVVDDELMRITHVIRGEEHLANTPRQIAMQKALGFREPTYAHLPLILAPDRSKLSKRFAEASMLSYRDAGYMPDALVNFLTLLGWHPHDDREVFSRDELIKTFDMKRVQKAGAVFNQEKLDWLNREYLKRLSADEILGRLAPLLPSGHALTHEQVLRIVELLRDRAKTLKDFVEHSDFFFRAPEYDGKLLVWKSDEATTTSEVLQKLAATCTEYGGTWEREHLLATLEPLSGTYGRGSVFWPLRVALSGLPASPDPIDIAVILGKHETLRRIARARELLSA
jgi:glutamyl-tRNA synthetase